MERDWLGWDGAPYTRPHRVGDLFALLLPGDGDRGWPGDCCPLLGSLEPQVIWERQNPCRCRVGCVLGKFVVTFKLIRNLHLLT
jgi:hypothetical protein